MVIVSISGLQESARDSRIKSEMNQLRTVAEIYKASHSGDYTGLTGDSQVSDLLEDITLQGGTAESNLFASSNSFCVFSLLAGSDESWCIDSLGYSGTGTCTNYQCNYNESSWSGGTLAEGLVGYWTMDQSDSSGSTLFDQSPYGNNGTIYGATFTADKNGNPNSAMSFDGSDDYIDYGNNSSLSMGLGSQSISLWVYFKNATFPSIETVFKNGAGGGGIKGFILSRYTNTTRLHMYINNGTLQNSVYLSDSGTLISDSWINIIVIFDRDSTVQAYINGVKQSANFSMSFFDGVNITNGRSTTIGGYTLSSWPADVFIDDVRVYNRVLSGSEIQQLYQLED
jgi:hypothetical protein